MCVPVCVHVCVVCVCVRACVRACVCLHQCAHVLLVYVWLYKDRAGVLTCQFMPPKGKDLLELITMVICISRSTPRFALDISKLLFHI